MKKLLIIVLTSFSLLGKAQDYAVFPDSMATWTNVYVHDAWNPNLLSVERFGLTNQDTVIGSNTYAQMFYQDTNYIGGIRYDTSKVYFALHGDTIEYLLYDFGAQIDDTIHDVFITDDGTTLLDNVDFELTDYIVHSIDSTPCADGILRKRLQVQGDAWVEWVEGIGNVGGIFWWTGANVSDYVVDMARLCVNDEAVYVGDNAHFFLEDTMQICQSDYTTGVIEFEKIGIQLYPNPVTGFLTIESIDPGNPMQLEILNSMGQIVLSAHFNGEPKSAIDLGNLSIGIYVAYLTSDGKSYSTKLIVE